MSIKLNRDESLVRRPLKFSIEQSKHNLNRAQISSGKQNLKLPPEILALAQKTEELGISRLANIITIYQQAQQSDRFIAHALEEAGKKVFQVKCIFQNSLESSLNREFCLKLKQLGEGSNHKVSLALRKKQTLLDGEDQPIFDFVALSKLKKNKSASSTEKQVIERLKDCPNIIQVLDYVDRYAVLELALGHLKRLLNHYSKDNSKIPKANLFIEGLLNAGTQMAQKNVLHLDLKPENVLISKKDKKVKLSDFESAILLNDQGLANSDDLPIGNMHYQSPERRQLDIKKMSRLASLEKPDLGLQDNVFGIMMMICKIAILSEIPWCQISSEFEKRFVEYDSLICSSHQKALLKGLKFSSEYRWHMQSEIWCYLIKLEEKNLFGGLVPVTPMDQIVKQMAAIDPKQRITIEQAAEMFLLEQEKNSKIAAQLHDHQS